MGVEVFLKFAKWKLGGKKCPCPCKKCRNRYWLSYKDVEHHLVSNGIEKSYYVWTLHGEDLSNIAVHPPVVANIGEKTIGDVAIEMEGTEEETIGEVGIGMGNFVDSSFGLHERVVGDGSLGPEFDEPYVPEADLGKRQSGTQGALTGVGLPIGYPTVIDESSTGLVVISYTLGTPASRAGIANICDAIATSEPLSVLMSKAKSLCFEKADMGHKGLWSTVDGKDPHIAKVIHLADMGKGVKLVDECTKISNKFSLI
ncbi:hypothetical protein IFM89_038171 [Coptis chinensis]|uniref:Transposase-associated domain-containing protein n=1 Tax=Coptis chinensis TaxID=261450 RepID=A0A835HN24_9MAGN|nr:hypothetical protein IFM89_038171 [Coptis chinensis]